MSVLCLLRFCPHLFFLLFRKAQHLLVSGSDDHSIRIWDLRNFKSGSPAAMFNWHSEAITSVEWHPHEESCLAVSSEDNSLSIWDMALEHDELPGHGAQVQEEIPPQLFFVHQGQRQIKELHWHKQIPNMVIDTAEDGFNIFKPSNLD
jgi:ribosome assembly protein RRB1